MKDVPFLERMLEQLDTKTKKKYYNLSVTCYTKSNKKCITGTSLCRGPGFKGSILGQGTRSHEDMRMKTWHRLKKIDHRYKYKTI